MALVYTLNGRILRESHWLENVTAVLYVMYALYVLYVRSYR